MAVVKLKYLRERPQLKAHLRYITHRRGREEGSITRVLFNANGLTDRRSVYELIDAARRGTVFYKFMINPDPAREDTHKDLDLLHITRQTILALERQLGLSLPFAAVLHPADHTALRHVHGIFLLPRRMSQEAFKKLRQIAWTTATAQARLQRRARDKVRAHPRIRSLSLFRARARSQQRAPALHPNQPRSGRRQQFSAFRQGRGIRGLRALRLQRGCSRCGFGRASGISIFLSVCPQCARPLTTKRMLRLTREVSV
jgi:hypothetical protein